MLHYFHSFAGNVIFDHFLFTGKKPHTIAIPHYVSAMMPSTPWNMAIQDIVSTLRLLIKGMAVSNFNEWGRVHIPLFFQRDAMVFKKCFLLPVSLFNWRWCTLLHNHGHNSICKVFPCHIFFLCVIQVCISSKNSRESSISSLQKKIYIYATFYVKCISSILSAARVTLVFFGFFPPYFWPTLIYYVPFTLGHLWQLQKLAEKFSKKEPSKKNDRELCLGKAALFSKSGSLKPSQTWVSFHF